MEKKFFLSLRDNTKIFIKIIDQKSQDWIVLNHGIREHSGRHKYLCKLFPNHNIVFYDLRGHGLSGGLRAWIDDFRVFSYDLKEIIFLLKEKFQMKNYILLGHSMGSLIVSDFIQEKLYCDFSPKKVFLMSPPIGSITWDMKALSNILQKLPFMFRFKRFIDLKTLSHDPRVALNYQEDPLSGRFFSLNLICELSNALNRVYTEELNSPCPLFVVYGGSDIIINTYKVKLYFSIFEKDAKVLEIKGAYHELYNETDSYYLPFSKFLTRSINGG